MNSTKEANKFMMFFLLYNCFAIVIMLLMVALLALKGWTQDEIMRFTLLAQDFIIFIAPMAFYMIFTGKSIKELIPLKKLSIKNAVYVVIITVLIMPMMSVVSMITNMFVEADVTESFQDIMLNFPWWLSVMFMAVMPPICEEAMFRGFILTGYKRVGFVKAAIITGLFFGMMHLDLYQLPYATFAGIVLAGFVYYTGSIFSSMLAHFVINGSQTAVFLLYTKLMDPAELEAELNAVTTVQDSINALYAMIGVMVFCLPFLLYFINRFIKRNRANYIEYCTGTSAIDSYDFERYEPKHKINDVFFVLTFVIYIAYMIVKSIFKL